MGSRLLRHFLHKIFRCRASFLLFAFFSSNANGRDTNEEDDGEDAQDWEGQMDQIAVGSEALVAIKSSFEGLTDANDFERLDDSRVAIVACGTSHERLQVKNGSHG